MGFMTNKLAGKASPLVKSIINEVVNKSIADLFAKENKARLALITRNWDFYNGVQSKYIEQHSREEQIEFNTKRKPHFNYVKLVIDQYIKGVFGQQITYGFSNEAAQEVWNSIIDNPLFFNMYGFMKKVQRIAELSNLCVVIPRFDNSTNKVYFEAIKGEYVTFIPKEGDPSRIGTIIIDYTYDSGFVVDADSSLIRRVEIWSEELIQVYEINQKGRTDIPKLVFESANIYKDDDGNPILLPTRFVPEEDEESWLGSSGINDITTLNLEYNSLWTDLFQILKYQTFSILFIKGESGSELKISPSQFLNLSDDNAEAKYLVPSAAIGDFAKILEIYKSELLDLSSLPVEVLAGSNKSVAESGYSLRIKRMPIEQLWDRRKVNYGYALRELIKKTLIFSGVHLNKKDLYSKKDSIKVDFSEVEIPMSPGEKLIDSEWKLNNALKTEIDLMIEDNPDLTKEQALVEFEENLKIRSGLLELKEKYLGKFKEESPSLSKIRGEVSAGGGNSNE